MHIETFDLIRKNLCVGLEQSDLDLEKTLNSFGAYKGKVIMWGDGSVYREFMCADDCAAFCVYIMKHKNAADIGECVNITSGKDIKLSAFYNLVKDVVGFDGIIEYDTSKPNGTYRKLMDASKMESLGWRPSIELRDGLKDTYDWYSTL